MSNIITVAGKIFSSKRLALVVVSLFLGVAAPFVAGNSASALPASCTNGEVCLYRHSSWGGDSVEVFVAGPTCYNLGFLNNLVSSVYNNTTFSIRYYANAGCDDLNSCFLQDGARSYRQDLAHDNWSLPPCNVLNANDAISSFRVY